MVVTALDGLPQEFGQLMRNVAVTAGHHPGPPGLLGLYQGIPLTSRTSQYTGVLPDRITIYRQAICAICRTEQEAAGQVRRTVIHPHSRRFSVTVTHLPVTRCQICHRTVAYRPGNLSEVLTGHYRRAHPEALGLPSR